jgi:hypothetical protein
MKNVYGLIIALALGAAGAMLNWSYIYRRSLDIDMVGFVGVKKDVVIEQGETFRADHFEEVQIPRNRIGDLESFAYTWDLRGTLVGMPVNRRYVGGDLVLKQDVKAAPLEGRKLADNEYKLGVPVDTRNFVPALVRAGDFVSFVVPRSGGDVIVPGSNGETPAGKGVTETIGPFEVWSVGTRVASADVARGSNQSHSQENVLMVIVKKDGDELEPKARKLADLLLTTSFQRVMVLAHARKGST